MGPGPAACPLSAAVAALGPLMRDASVLSLRSVSRYDLRGRCPFCCPGTSSNVRSGGWKGNMTLPGMNPESHSTQSGSPDPLSVTETAPVPLLGKGGRGISRDRGACYACAQGSSGAIPLHETKFYFRPLNRNVLICHVRRSEIVRQNQPASAKKARSGRVEKNSHAVKPLRTVGFPAE